MTKQNHPSTPFESGYVPVNGLKMYYEIHGSGRPLVRKLVFAGGPAIDATASTPNSLREG